MTVKEINGNIEIHGLNNFALRDTLDCGQAFRWREVSSDCFEGFAYNKFLRIGFKDNCFILYNTSIEDFENIWKNYFDIERDYGEIISGFSDNPILKAASEFACGIRILKQEPWEALCSFIISQNNNIPRIKGIIERLCENFGKKDASGYFSFPTPEKIATLSLTDLQVLRSGFRAKYILDAAKKVADGTIQLEKLRGLDTDTARQELMKIYGVGAKVADCTLLFGLGHLNAFPKDVWIKRALESLCDGILPECTKGYEGIAQQYIFHYARITKLKV